MAKYGLTPQGPNPKRLDVILEDMHSKMTERLGVNTRQNPQSLLNHTLTNVADEIAELWEFGVDVYHSQYTSSATGVSLDYAAQFGGSTREMAAKSYYSILCTGLDGTTIPAGTVIASDTNPATSLTATADATITRSAFNKATVILASPAATTALGVALNGNLYTITPDPKQSTSEALEALGTAITDKDFHVTVINDTIVIEAVDETSSNTLVLSENLTTASVGSIVTFETAEPGDIFIPNGVITKITKAVPGMESVVNVGSYVAGQLAESDVEFRKSYTNKIYNRSSAMLESIKSAILKNVQGGFYAAESIDAACLCVQDLLGNFCCIAALDHNFDAVRPPAGRIDFICAVFIGSYAHHTLHILQDGALDAFQHGRRAVVDFIGIGPSELHIAFSQPPRNIGANIGHRGQSRHGLYDLRNYAIRNKDVSGIHGLKCDDASNGGRGQIF